MKGRIVCAAHKTASMFLFRLAQEITNRDSSLLLVSPNLNPPNVNVLKNCESDYILCPYRNYQPIPRYITKGCDTFLVVCQVRDPKDLLVSQYYSHGFIHAESKWNEKSKSYRQDIIKGMDINDYCIKALREDVGFAGDKSLILKIDDFYKLREQSSPKIVKYEDMVLNFERYLADFLSGLELQEFYDVCFEKFKDEFNLENINQRIQSEQLTHKRHILPGDHKNQLSSKTIEIINKALEPFVNEFGY